MKDIPDGDDGSIPVIAGICPVVYAVNLLLIEVRCLVILLPYCRFGYSQYWHVSLFVSYMQQIARALRPEAECSSARCLSASVPKGID